MQKKYSFTLLSLFLLAFHSWSQELPAMLEMGQAVDSALSNNLSLKVTSLQTQANSFVQPAQTEALQISYTYGNILGQGNDYLFEAEQSLPSPWAIKAAKRYAIANSNAASTQYKMQSKQLCMQVKLAYLKWVYHCQRLALWQVEDSACNNFLKIASLHYLEGETNMLEKSLAEVNYAELRNKVTFEQTDSTLAANDLFRLMHTRTNYVPSSLEADLYSIAPSTIPLQRFSDTLGLTLGGQHQLIAQSLINKKKAEFFPDFTIGYFNRSVNGLGNFQGIKAGLVIPFWFGTQRKSIEKARVEAKLATVQAESDHQQALAEIEDLLLQLNASYKQISNLRQASLKQADLLLSLGKLKYEQGDISYSEYAAQVSAAMRLKASYLEQVYEYNRTAVKLEYYVE